MFRRRRPRPSGVSWGELHPVRQCEWVETESRVSLVVPRLGRGALARAFERWLRVRPYQVHLDDLGTYVWHRCDGSTAVTEIVSGLRDEFGDRAEPAEDRLVDFLKSLARGRFVSFAPYDRGH